jgi:hypothetical protein
MQQSYLMSNLHTNDETSLPLILCLDGGNYLQSASAIINLQRKKKIHSSAALSEMIRIFVLLYS